MDKTLPINILLGNRELCTIVAMKSWINFGPSVFSVTVTVSKFSSQYFGNVPQSGLCAPSLSRGIQ